MRFNKDYGHRVTDLSLANNGTLIMVTLNSKIMVCKMTGKSNSDEIVSLPSERVEVEVDGIFETVLDVKELPTEEMEANNKDFDHDFARELANESPKFGSPKFAAQSPRAVGGGWAKSSPKNSTPWGSDDTDENKGAGWDKPLSANASPSSKAKTWGNSDECTKEVVAGSGWDKPSSASTSPAKGTGWDKFWSKTTLTNTTSKCSKCSFF